MKKTLDAVLRAKEEARKANAAKPVAEKMRALDRMAERKRQLKLASNISTSNKRNSR